MLKEFNNFLNKEQCNTFLKHYEKNYLYHKIYRDTITYEIKESFKEREYVLNYVSNFNLTLNYDQIVMWPNNSHMQSHKDGTVFKDNHFVSICYLNNNYIGGRTVIENKLIDNDLGKLIVFNSCNLLHGVEQVTGTRLVYISWWKSKI
jgi:predicted 2-oxoglutarate/Fe(II)-dependent dioxygenase YbiX